MTYNFDPDKWYDIELFALRSKYRTGDLTQLEYENATEKLEQQREKMWERLDGSYQVPNGND